MITLGHAKGFGFLGAMVLSAFGLAGCGGEAPSDDSGEAIGSQQQGLAGLPCDWTNLVDFDTPVDGIEPNDYTWGPPTSSHFCALTRLDGLDPLNGGYHHYAFVGQEGGKWFIKGRRGKMTCTPIKCFSHPSSQAVAWSQPTYWVSSGNDCSNTRDMFWGDAASVLNGVLNDRAPGGWADTISAAHRVYVNDRCQAGHLEGFGTSFYVGVPSTGDNTGLSEEKIVGQAFAFQSQNLIRLDEGLCFFTNAGFDLVQPDRSILIKHVVSTNRWVLTSVGSRFPQASARCIYYAQN
jgi:hypothetical protein